MSAGTGPIDPYPENGDELEPLREEQVPTCLACGVPARWVDGAWECPVCGLRGEAGEDFGGDDR